MAAKVRLNGSLMDYDVCAHYMDDEIREALHNNLCGRTHYVDQDTLRWHKSKIISSHVVDGGLLFAIVTSDALDMQNTKRGFRYVIFDVAHTRDAVEQAAKHFEEELARLSCEID
jgi:hypothetical protein